MRLLVPGQRKRRGLHSLQSVAAFAVIEVRSRHELPIVLIFVAIGALLKLNLEERVFAFGDMTLRTVDGEMFPFERIGRGGVVLRRKRRRLETLHRVAGPALASPGP